MSIHLASCLNLEQHTYTCNHQYCKNVLCKIVWLDRLGVTITIFVFSLVVDNKIFYRLFDDYNGGNNKISMFCYSFGFAITFKNSKRWIIIKFCGKIFKTFILGRLPFRRIKEQIKKQNNWYFRASNISNISHAKIFDIKHKNQIFSWLYFIAKEPTFVWC